MPLGAEPTLEDWREMALHFHGRVVQLEAERDGKPVPPDSEFTDAGWAAKWDRIKSNFPY
jgi:hypothetical protein